MNVARHTKRLLAALMASTLTVVDVHAAVTDIFSQPLATTSTIVAKPNIMFILDNSGSMASAYMPDDMDDTGKYGFKSMRCNGLAFDPTYTYTPPIKADGTSYADASFTNALNDGFAYQGNGTLRFSTNSRTVGTGTKTFTLDSGNTTSYPIGDQVAVSYQVDGAARMTGTVTAWDASTLLLTLNITAVEGSGTYNSWYVSRMLTLDGSTYYNYTGSQPLMGWTYNNSGVITSTTFYQECMSNVGSTPGSSVFTLQTVNSGSAAAMRQNYANWNAYYRTRRLLMRTAAGRAFQALDNKFRVGFTTISDTSATQGTNRFIDIGDFDTTKKAAFYKSLYTADGDSYTPLRGSLSKVGRYFANKAPGQTSDPMQYSCQRNYAILSTDGYWNNNSESSTYGPFQLTSNTSVGQQDAGESKPMHDGALAITTTVTPYTTITRYSQAQTRTDTANWRRYEYVVPSGKGSGSCNNSQYRILVSQQRNRTGSTPVTLASIDDTTVVVTNTKVVNAATSTIISDTNATTSNTTAHISTSVASTGTTTFGAWPTGGTSTDYCRTATELTALGMSPGTTYYSTAGCSGANNCTYTSTTANGTQTSSNTGSASNSGAPTQVSQTGPTAGTAVATDSFSGGASTTLADVAEYYYKTDLRTAALNNCTGNGGNDVCSNSTMLPLPPLDLVTTQHMVTLTIGLGVSGTLTYDPNYLGQTTAGQTYADLKSGAINWPDPMPSEGARRIDDLWHAAVNGRGRYFATNNANTLSNALSGALADATKATGSAAGAATNSLEPVVGENNKAFIATYTTLEWTGDIRAYALDAMTGVIDTSTAAWSAKTQLEALAAGSRNIKYMNSSKVMRTFNYANLNADGFGTHFSNLCSKTPTPLQCTTLGTAQVTLAETGANLVNYLRGDNTYDAAVNSTNPLYRARTAKLGDIINASPVYVKKSPLQYLDTGYAAFSAGTATRKAMLYSAANDGMLHAFDASTGSELWAFVPSYVMPNMYKLADTDYRDHHSFFVDGTPVVGDIYTGSAWKTILVGGLNSGGKGYYALDITDPDNPVALWEFTDTNMGLTYGNPVITKRADGTWVVAVSSGYNNVTGDGQGRLYLINAATGALVTSLSTGVGSSPASPSGLGKINAWVDSGADNTAKRFYGGDMLGNLWRFDFDDLVAPAGAEVTRLATFQIGATPQPITTKPQLTVITTATGTKVPVIVVGTGRYLGTSDVTDTTQQSIYAIKDPLSGAGWGDVRSRVDLVSQTVTNSGVNGTGSNNTVDWSTKIGWKMDLPQSKERVVTDFVLQFNVLSVASAIPGANECNPSGGASWLYQISAGSGTAANGANLSEYLGAFLVVGMTSIKTADGHMKIEIVGSDATVRTKEPPPPDLGNRAVRRSAWRELIN
jgi:type IV pilus assembly protein PilY1